MFPRSQEENVDKIRGQRSSTRQKGRILSILLPSSLLFQFLNAAKCIILRAGELPEG